MKSSICSLVVDRYRLLTMQLKIIWTESGKLLRVPHYLENRLKDGGKAVSLTCRPHFTPQENYLINSWYSFLLEAE
jgi:hypothetical protein